MNFKDFIYKISNKKALKVLDKFEKHPELVTPEDEKKLDALYSRVIRALGVSESAKWCVKWEVQKFADKFALDNNRPYETRVAAQNVVTNKGATEMLKLICGLEGANAFSNANAKIGVGSDSTPEDASQTGLLASEGNVFYKNMESGYPKVEGRTMIFKSNFSDGEANFPWNEFSVVNGTGIGGIAMNRKMQNLGTKTTGIWSLQITISVTSNN